MANGYKDWTEVEITKKLDKNGTLPDTIFEFEIGENGSGQGTGIRDGVGVLAPVFDTKKFSITVAQDKDSATANINLPDFENYGVGVFTYKIYEKDSKIAGIEYDEGPKELVITVINNPDYRPGGTLPKYWRLVTITDKDKGIKVDSFNNKFNTGTLTVYKEVTGNMGDKQRKFDITVTLTAPEGKTVTAPIYVGEDTNNPHTFDKDGKLEIKLDLAHGEGITINNIPYGVTYDVTETLPEGLGYKNPRITYSDSDKVINEGEAPDSVTVTNEKDVSIETGINLDNAPYIAILAVAIGGLALFLIRRRMAVNL